MLHRFSRLASPAIQPSLFSLDDSRLWAEILYKFLTYPELRFVSGVSDGPTQALARALSADWIVPLLL